MEITIDNIKSALSKVVEPDLNKDIITSQLASLPDFLASDPVQQLDLSGGITLFYNPENHKTKLLPIN